MLSPGTRLGSYEVVAPLGSGGMGEVYRARDTRLNRDVAIKVLPPVFAGDPDRLARFEREAQVLASLNHPGIAHVYGVEESSGVDALVMELVEGPTLADRLAAGALPLAEALAIARQIADALDAAHEQGIVHRDLKPANVKVREDGMVKVLDFGLAKALDPAASSTASAANSPTLSVHATMQGVILGTAAYMSPEQAKGRSVDRRADIWAFGAVLFEMLAGRVAFAGDSTTEILGAVVLRDPDWSALPASTPPRLRDVLRRCLQKDPRARQRDIGDVRLELSEIAAGPAGDATALPAAGRSRRSIWIGAGALTLAAASIGIVIGTKVPRARTDRIQPVTRFTVPTRGYARSPVISPDGRLLVYVSDDRLYRRDLHGFESVPIAGSEGAVSPFLSPDGRWIGFFAGGKIKRVSSSGGDPLVVADASGSTPGAGWGPDNTILFSPGWATPLFSVSAEGGQPAALTTVDTAHGERAHWWPQLLPGGRQFLFTVWMAGSGVNDARLAIFDVETRRHRVLFPGADGEYLASGHILYFHAGAWHVVPFDAASGRTTGDPVNVLEDAVGLTPDGTPGRQVSASLTGTLVYHRGPLIPTSEFMWATRDGSLEPLRLPIRAFNDDAALSPDGRRIVAARIEAGAFELWLYDVERKTEDRFAAKGSNFNPIWDSRGETLAFISERKGEYDTYAAEVGGGDARAIFTRDFDEAPRAWTRDGRRMIVQEWHPDGSTPLALIEIGNVANRKVIRSGTNGADNLRLSRDERWMVYESAISGRGEVYVQSFPEPAPPVRISSRGGRQAFWSPTSSEIFYHHEDELVSVQYRDEGGRFVVAGETVLFQLPAPFDLHGVTPDGRRFLIRRPVEPPPPPGIRVVLGWFDELKAGRP